MEVKSWHIWKERSKFNIPLLHFVQDTHTVHQEQQSMLPMKHEAPRGLCAEIL